MTTIKSYGRLCSFIFKALIGKWYRFHLLEELLRVEIREPLRNSATLGLIGGREALFMKENFIQNMLESTV